MKKPKRSKASRDRIQKTKTQNLLESPEFQDAIDKKMESRECGDCTVCCTTMYIPDLTEQYQTCKHVCAKGCGIYKEKPDACGHFQCLWKLWPLPDDKRPDKSGYMIYIQDVPNMGGEILIANEAWPRAFKNIKIMKELEKLALDSDIVLVTYPPEPGIKEMFGPPAKLAAAQKHMEDAANDVNNSSGETS